MIVLSPASAGVLWIVLCCMIGAAFEVFLGHVVQSLDPIAVNTFCFGLICVVHLSIELARSGRKFLAKARAAAIDLLFFNLSTLASSATVAISFRWLEPSASKVIVSSVGPMLTVAVGPWLLKGWRAGNAQKFAAVGTGISALALALGALTGNTGATGVSADRALLGILAACAAGAGIVFNTLYMKRFERRGWSISEMLAGRLIVVTALGLFLWPKGAGTPGIGDLPALTAVAVGWVWVPIYTFQWGLKTCDPLAATLIISASPLLTLVFQAFDRRLAFSALTVAAVALNAASAVYGNLKGVAQDTFSEAHFKL